MGRYLSEIDWYMELMFFSPEQQYTRFREILYVLVERYFPLRNKTNKENPPWPLNPSRTALNAKSQAWSQFKQSRSMHGRGSPITLTYWNCFKRASENVMFFCINAQKDYERNIARQINTSPKLFHSYLKHRKV